MRANAIALTAVILLSISVFANLGTASASSFDVTSVTWGTAAAPIEAGPGDRNVPLTVTLQYFGWYTATSVRATLDLPPGFTDLNGSAHAVGYVTGIVPNSFFQLAFNLNIYSNVSLTASMFTLKLMWNTTWDTNLNQELIFPVEVKGRVRLEFDTPTVYLKPGTVNDVVIRVNNRGTGNASEINTYVTAPSQVSLLGTLKDIHRLDAGSSAKLKLTVYVSPQAANSPITFSISSTYRDAYLNLRSVGQSLGFIIGGVEQTIFKVHTSTDYLTPNDLNHVNVTVDNRGSTTMRDLRIRFSSQPPVSIICVDGEVYLGTLSPQERIEFPIIIYLSSTSSDSATIPLTITYMDESQTIKSEARTLTFLLNKISELSPISIKVQPNILVAGKANNLTITISNIGTVPLRSISVSYSFQSGQFTWLQPDISQIGQLLPGQTFLVDAKVFDPPTSTASTVLQANIRYYDSQNNLKQEIRNIGLLSQGLIDLQMVDYSILPEKPTIGQIFSVTVTLTNIGTIVSSAVTATPHPPSDFKMFGSNSIFIGDMQVNTPTTFTLSILISDSTKPGRYHVPIELTYFDNLRNQYSVTRNITVEVYEKSSTQTSTRALTPEPSIFTITTYVITGVTMLVLGLALGKRFSRK